MAAIGGRIPLFALGLGSRFGTAAATNFSVDAADDGLVFVFQAPETGPTITKAAIRLGALTGSSPTYVVSLQGVDLSTGLADGTIKSGTGSNDVFVETNPASGAGTILSVTFGGSGYNSSSGEWLALCIYPKAGTTINGSNFWSFTRYLGGGVYTEIPYNYSDTAGTKSKADGGCFAVSDGTTWFGGDCLYEDANTYSSPNDSGSPVYAGNWFTLPAGMGDTVSCVGFWAQMTYTASASAYKVALYDAGDNVLADLSVDKDLQYAGYGVHYWDSAAVALTCGSAYRIVGQGTGALFRLAKHIVTAAEYWNAHAWGQNVKYTEGSAGSWTETATARSLIGPIISDITEPAAGGGVGVIHQYIGLGR